MKRAKADNELDPVKKLLRQGHIASARIAFFDILLDHHEKIFSFFRHYDFIESKNFTATVSFSQKKVVMGSHFFCDYINSFIDLEFFFGHERDHYIIASIYGSEYLKQFPYIGKDLNFIDDAFINWRQYTKVPSLLAVRFYKKHNKSLFLQSIVSKFAEWAEEQIDIPRVSRDSIIKTMYSLYAGGLSYEDYAHEVNASKFFHWLDLRESKESEKSDEDEDESMQGEDEGEDEESQDGEEEDGEEGDGDEGEDEEEDPGEGETCVIMGSESEVNDKRGSHINPVKEGLLTKFYVENFSDQTLLSLLGSYKEENDFPVPVPAGWKELLWFSQSNAYKESLNVIVGDRATVDALGVKRISSPFLPLSPSREDAFMIGAGCPPLEFEDTLPAKRYNEADEFSLYIDTSGSVSPFWPSAAKLAREAAGIITSIFYFSDICVGIDPEELIGDAPFILTTGGTRFENVASHIIQNGIRKVAIMTDDDNEGVLLGQPLLDKLEVAVDLLLVLKVPSRIPDTFKAFNTKKTKYIALNPKTER